jgi:phosphatidylglycerol lysyltransferase
MPRPETRAPARRLAPKRTELATLHCALASLAEDVGSCACMSVSPDRMRVLGLLRAFGWNATSFQILESGFSYWFDDDLGCVAYVDTGRAWVAAGAPIAAEAQLLEVAHRFARAARERGRGAIFFGTEHRFIHRQGFESLLIGAQPVWDPRDWQATLRRAPSLREQLRRARAKGVSVRLVQAEEVGSPDAPLRLAIEALVDDWSGAKAMPPMGFLVRVEPFVFAEERRLFVAFRDLGASTELVGFASAIPVYARRGWFIENLIRSPRSPNGTTDLLVDAAMRTATELGSTYLTLGLSPLAGDVGFSLHLARRYGSALYDFGGLRGFKGKFRPREWSPIYLSYPSAQTGPGALYHSLAAFSQTGLFRYGMRALLRGPDVVVRALALLLIPWTVVLGSLNGEHWFPAPWVQWSWVAFDIALCIALFALSLRFRRWLSATLLGLVISDAVLTFIQALAFNIWRTESVLGAMAVVLAIAAPTIASLVLLNAHLRRSKLAAAGQSVPCSV